MRKCLRGLWVRIEYWPSVVQDLNSIQNPVHQHFVRELLLSGKFMNQKQSIGRKHLFKCELEIGYTILFHLEEELCLALAVG